MCKLSKYIQGHINIIYSNPITWKAYINYCMKNGRVPNLRVLRNTIEIKRIMKLLPEEM